MPEDWMYGERSKLWPGALQTGRNKQEVKQADFCFLFLCMFFFVLQSDNLASTVIGKTSQSLTSGIAYHRQMRVESGCAQQCQRARRKLQQLPCTVCTRSWRMRFFFSTVACGKSCTILHLVSSWPSEVMTPQGFIDKARGHATRQSINAVSIIIDLHLTPLSFGRVEIECHCQQYQLELHKVKCSSLSAAFSSIYGKDSSCSDKISTQWKKKLDSSQSLRQFQKHNSDGENTSQWQKKHQKQKQQLIIPKRTKQGLHPK